MSEAFQKKATPGEIPELKSGVEHDRPTSETAKLSVIDDLCVGCSYCLMTCKDNALIVEGVCVVIEDNCNQDIFEQMDKQLKVPENHDPYIYLRYNLFLPFLLFDQ